MTKSRARLATKLACFMMLTCLCVSIVNELLKPKYYYNETWPSTSTFMDFYRLDKNSVDVLFFGSSHGVCSFDPQTLYDNYGITSYNLSSEQQSIIVSYYWLREALKYQTPKAVVLDTYMLHKFGADFVYNEMNCSESAVRKAMDSMRLSPLKWEAAKSIEKIDPSQDALSFIFLNIRYHARWENLSENDFSERAMIEHGGVKGFTVFGGGTDPNSIYTPFTDAQAETTEADAMVGSAAEYLDKMAALCKEHEIQLILTNIPCGESPERYKATKDYAQENGLPYYDFNEESLYKEIGYDSTIDLLSHPSYFGARKITNFLGNLLINQYGVTSRVDSSFDKSREVYLHKIENAELLRITNLNEYLPRLQNEKYSIFIFAPTAYGATLNEDVMNTLFALGFTTELRDVQDGWHYCAVKDGTNIVEQFTREDCFYTGSVRNGLVPYQFQIDTKFMTPSSHIYSMQIDSVECGGGLEQRNLYCYI